MARLALSSLLFIAVTFLSASSVSAQFGLVQNDYDRYTQLFKTGKEPNLSPIGSPNWRDLYRKHNWKAYAEPTEQRDPMVAAQVLMGVYLVSHVDHALTYQIDSIIYHGAHMSNALSESIALDRIEAYMRNRQNSPNAAAGSAASSATGGSGDSFYSPEELERFQRMGRDLNVIARNRMVSGRQINARQKAEIRSAQNLFYRDTQDINNWAAAYSFMREKILILDGLAESFTFNWDEARREEEVQKLMDSDKVRRLANERTRTLRAAPAMATSYGNSEFGNYDDETGEFYAGSEYGGPSSASTGLSAEDIEKIKEEMPQTVAEELMQEMEARHNAYKYIVGVYQGSEYHLGDLRRIYRYFSNAAEQGNPIAQYHLALFTKYLGDIMDPDREEDENAYQELLHQAATSDLAKERVEKLGKYFAQESQDETKRNASSEKRLEALKKVENNKLDMIDVVLERVQKKIGTGTGGGAGGGGIRGGGGRGGDSGGDSSE